MKILGDVTRGIFAPLWLRRADCDDMTPFVAACGLATAESASCSADSPELLRTEGFALLHDALPAPLRQKLLDATQAFMMRLRDASTGWDIGMSMKPHRNSNHALCFEDVVQRDAGKLELQLPELREDAEVVRELEAGAWRPAVASVLGDRFELVSATIIVSTAVSLLGEPAVDQGWHSDGSFKAGRADGSCRNCVELEPGQAYGVVAYLPLEDVPEDGGRVEYQPSTHTNLSVWTELVEAEHSGDAALLAALGALGLPGVRRPSLMAGDVLLYDFRLRHRGLARRVRTGERPILKLDYFRYGLGDRDNSWCVDRGSALREPGCPDMLARNDRAECASWAAMGECDANGRFMLRSCSLACCMLGHEVWTARLGQRD